MGFLKKMVLFPSSGSAAHSHDRNGFLFMFIGLSFGRNDA